MKFILKGTVNLTVNNNETKEHGTRIAPSPDSPKGPISEIFVKSSAALPVLEHGKEYTVTIDDGEETSL